MSHPEQVAQLNGNALEVDNYYMRACSILKTTDVGEDIFPSTFPYLSNGKWLFINHDSFHV